MKNPLLLIGVFVCSFLSAQTKNYNEEALIKEYESYFQADRKNIHLHLNKTVFIAGEHIWFSTYLLNHTQNMPSKEKEYVYVDLIKETGEVIVQKTILYDNGKGNGDIFLANSLPSGLYFLQAYTASMQNLEEDDSTKYPILVKNLNSGELSNYEYATKEDVPQIQITAEGGHLIQGVFGKCVARITDKNGTIFNPDSVLLVDESRKKVSSLDFSKKGIVPFSFLPIKGKRYFLEVFRMGEIFTKEVPATKSHGVALSFVRNPKKREIVVQVADSRAIKDKNRLILCIHKDKNIAGFPIQGTAATGKSQFRIEYDALLEGINTITIIDRQGKVHAERVFYQHAELNTGSFRAFNSQQKNDSLQLAFDYGDPSIYVDKQLSISILPGETKSQQFRKKAFFALYLEAYFPGAEWTDLWSKEIESLDDVKFMDELAIMAKPKYDWKNILNENLGIPNKYVLTGGIHGVVEAINKRVKPSSILLYSKENELLLSTEVIENKFSFKELIFEKGSKLNFSLVGKDGKPHKANFSYTIKPSITNFRHRFKTNDVHKSKRADEELWGLNPNNGNTEELDEVTVSAKELKYEKFFKPFFGIKVDSTIGMTSLKDMFIKEGFLPVIIPPSYPDLRRAGAIELTRFSRLCGDFVFPSIIVDGVFDRYISAYENLPMEFIDEIYIDRPDSCSFLMVVFTNEKYKNRPLPENQITSKEIIMDKGYELPKPFKRSDYLLNNNAFEHFGILGWHSDITSFNKKPLKIKVPIDNQDKIRIVVEGYSDSGNIISEDYVISLN